MFSWQPLNQVDRTGHLPLHTFAREGNWKWVRKLMLKGVSVNQNDAHGFTTLHHAVLSGCVRTVLVCLPRNSPIGEVTDLTHRSRDRHTPLHTACKLGFASIVHALVSYCDWMELMSAEQRDDYLNARTTDDKTALALAVIKGWRDIVAYLCASGADVNRTDRTLRNTPLMWAEKMRDWDATVILLSRGADLDAKDAGGRQAFQTLEVLKELRQPPWHDIPAANKSKYAYERKMVTIDGRYRAGKAVL